MRIAFQTACMAMLGLAAWGQRPALQPPGLRLGLQRPAEFALEPLGGRERELLAEPGIRRRTGIHRTFPAAALATGRWEAIPGGERVWRLALRSPGFTGIRLEFRDFDIGAGRVWLHSGDQVAGPFTGRGHFGDGHFWTPTVFSESALLEYEPDPARDPADGLPFEIRTLSMETAEAVNPVLDASTRDTADYCHLDPNCYPEWQDSMKMVAQLSYEDAGARYVCSGALVATRDNSRKPYLLTAGHCIDNEASARSLEVYWTYQTPKCSAAPPDSRDSSTRSAQGANLLGFAPVGEGDYSFLLLRDAPPGTLFANWDITDPPAGAALAGIHHPAGSWKRIAFGARSADTAVVVEDQAAPASKFLEVTWLRGRVEHGSSGSPLFSAPGVIVGSLSYGLFSNVRGVCAIEPSFAGYGRFSNVYPGVKDYLENLPAAAVSAAAPDARFSVLNGAPSPARQTVRLTTQSAGEVRYRLRADAPWIRLSAAGGTVSAAQPATVEISIDTAKFDRPDKYQSTVTILAGAAEPRFVNVAADVKADRSSVAATVTPLSGDGGASFQVRLREAAGVSTRITAVKVNGFDYSSSLKDWFGTTLLPARGTLEATLSTDSPFPSGAQFFEFRGADEGTGRTWYVAASATF